MPVLDLPDLHLPEAGLYLFSVMLYPHDAKRQSNYVEAFRAKAVLKVAGENPYRVKREAVREVVAAAHAPRLEDTLKPVTPLCFGGTVAAQSLCWVLSCAERSPAQASLLSARRALEPGLRKTFRRGTSPANLKMVWKRYMPVAHFWMTLFAWRELWKESAGNGSKLALWLALAEETRRLGEGFVPLRASTPVLDPTRTWKVPDRFLLPKVTVEMPHFDEIQPL